MVKKIIIKADDAGRRLDAVLSCHLDESSRSQIKKWINEGFVKVGGEVKKTSYKVRLGDCVEIYAKPPVESKALPQNIQLDILYEDADIIIVNKSADMVVHPAAGNQNGTLVNALLYHCRDLSGVGGVLRPGIVHRLDKGTSGVIIVAKNDNAHLKLSAQFKDRIVRKTYYALVFGSPKSASGTFDLEIGRHPTDRKKMSTKTSRGRSAVTHWEVVERFGNHFSLVKIRLVTGRTHQIRVHFSAHGMPLLGDVLYGGKKTVKRLSEGHYREIAAKALRPMLHASELVILHPASGKEIKFSSELPDDFKSILEELRAIP